MKRILLFSVIILSSFNLYASARWIDVGSNPSGSVFFIDAESIQKSGDSYTFWALFNYAKRNADGTLSFKSKLTIKVKLILTKELRLSKNKDLEIQ